MPVQTHGTHHRRGFTLIEGILALTIVALMGGITVPLYMNYQIQNDLNLAMQQATQGLRRAQLLSQAREGDSVWGFFVPAGTLYKGDSYSERDEAFDEVYPMPSSITVSGSILEVSYSREGLPDRFGNIILTDLTGGQRIITILVPEVGIPANQSDLSTICHCPPGNQGCNTLYISENAWPAHQAHGDTLGSCPGSSAGAQSSSAVSSAPASSSSASSAGNSSAACQDRFSVSSDGTITASGPVDVLIRVLGSQITYGAGGPEIDVYVSASTNGGTTWQSLYNGRDVDGGETQTLSGLVSGNRLLLRARGYFRRGGWLTFDRTYSTPDSSGHLVVLRDGDTPPDYPAFDDQDSLASYLQDILDAQGKIDIGQYELAVIGEIGVQNLQTNSSAVDFQDIVLKLEFSQQAGSCS